MNNPTNPRFLAQREQEPLTQVRAITALLALSQEDAPAVEWMVERTGRRLEGILTPPGMEDRDRRRGLAAWQRAIGAGPVQGHQVGSSEHLVITGSYEGI